LICLEEIVGLPEKKGYRLAALNQRELILQNDAVTLYYYPELKIVHHELSRVPESEKFRELLSKGADLVERHRASKWLSDDRANTVLRDHDENWSEREWLPRVVRGGFKYWAIVLPKAAIGKLNMRRLAGDHVRRGVEVQVVETPEAAFRWLQER
jgi:hypothetical protein